MSSSNPWPSPLSPGDEGRHAALTKVRSAAGKARTGPPGSLGGVGSRVRARQRERGRAGERLISRVMREKHVAHEEWKELTNAGALDVYDLPDPGRRPAKKPVVPRRDETPHREKECRRTVCHGRIPQRDEKVSFRSPRRWFRMVVRARSA